MTGSPARPFYPAAIFVWCWLTALLGMLFGYRVSAIVFFVASAVNAATIVFVVSRIGLIKLALTPATRWRLAAATGAVITLGDVLFFYFFLRRLYVWIPLGMAYAMGIADARYAGWETGGLMRWEARAVEAVRSTRRWLTERWEIKDLALRAALVYVLLFAPRSKDALLFLPWAGLASAVAAHETMRWIHRRSWRGRRAFFIEAGIALATGLISGFLTRSFRSRLFLPSYAHGIIAASLVFFLAWRRMRSSSRQSVSRDDGVLTS